MKFVGIVYIYYVMFHIFFSFIYSFPFVHSVVKCVDDETHGVIDERGFLSVYFMENG